MFHAQAFVSMYICWAKMETSPLTLGLWKPTGGGDFMIQRPHASFGISSYFNRDHDPFPRLEEVTMKEGDFLLVTPQKTGEVDCLQIDSNQVSL